MELRLRFMAKVKQSASGCWEWTAAIQQATGYGRFGMNGQTTYAHRASWMIFKGPIPAGLYVCHRCDNRICVNPDHLFVGSASQNMKDAARKGRVVIPARSYASDESHQPAKLTNAEVLEIRRSSLSAKELARTGKYQVSYEAIWLAKSGRSFRDVRA